MACHVKEQSKDHYGDERKAYVEQNRSGPRRTPIFPVVEFGTLGDSYCFLLLKIGRKGTGCRVPVLGIALHGAVDDFLQLRGDRRIKLPGWRRVVEQPIIHDEEGVLAGEWHSSSQHLVKHYAEGKEVAASIAPLAFDLFRRNVVRRAHGLGEFREG